ncbi:MAG: hypothetical protein QW578_07790, partial [Thermoplasmatales archaeon]
SFSSTTSTISFSETNGTYSYTIATTDKIYKPSPSSGSFTVNGASLTESITFSLVTYTVTFTESGLPSGTTWSVTLNGITESSTTNTISFLEPNGSYIYSIGSISGYRVNVYNGTIIVNGSALNNSVVWSIVTYPITITQSGIPNGTTWSVTLSGTAFNGQFVNSTLTSSTGTITFNEPNGSYTYTVHLPSGYTSSNAKGSVSVSGAPVSVTISAQPPTNYLLYVIILIVVIIAVLGVVIAMRQGKKKQGPKQWQEPAKEKPEEEKK